MASNAYPHPLGSRSVQANSAIVTSYGQLQWDDNGTLRNMGNDIEAFTFRSNGMAYVVLHGKLVAYSDVGDYFPVLTEVPAGNYSLGGVAGLTDVESLAFWEPPAAPRLRSAPVVPEPLPGILIGFGLVALGLGVNRFKSKRRDSSTKS